MRHVDDQASTRLQNAGEVTHETPVVRDMLQKIDNEDLIEGLVRKRRGPAIELIHAILYQVADRCDGPWIEIRTVPAPAALTQQVADDAVIGPDSQAGSSHRIVHELEQAVVLGLFQNRTVEERDRPFCTRVAHALILRERVLESRRAA